METQVEIGIGFTNGYGVSIELLGDGSSVAGKASIENNYGDHYDVIEGWAPNGSMVGLAANFYTATVSTVAFPANVCLFRSALMGSATLRHSRPLVSYRQR